MKHLFITGMGRSGTSLLDKLITNHKNIDVLSQPLPLLFIEIKKQFLKKKGIDKYYVLNDDLISRQYQPDQFNNFLKNASLIHEEIEGIFHSMQDYSGQSTRADLKHINDSGIQQGFRKILEKSLGYYRPESGATHLGIKEIMCEEFLPYLCEANYKCIVIIRDPRDVLASANYPKGTKYLGNKRPSLFILKSWRKSVEYTYILSKQNNFHFLRYEDLVNDPYRELNKITRFLGVDHFPDKYFEKGILDRHGNIWQANSSFKNDDSFISQKSKGIYKEVLSAEEIKFTETVCKYEMDWLDYPREFDIATTTSIEGFTDSGIEHNRHLPANFSSLAENIEKEIERLKSFSQFYFQN